MKFKIKSYIIESFETEIEADSEDEAKELFAEKFDSGEIESIAFTEPTFEGDEEYEVIDSFFNNEEDDLEDDDLD